LAESVSFAVGRVARGKAAFIDWTHPQTPALAGVSVGTRKALRLWFTVGVNLYTITFCFSTALYYFCRMKTETSILFVCLGNICRSPAAEGIFRALVERKGMNNLFYIDSAGTYAGHRGELPDPRMRSAAARRGYRLNHRSRPVREEDFERFDLILAMDDNNYETLYRLAPSRKEAERIERMVKFVRKYPDRHYVPDPYYEGREGFELVLDLLEDACEGLLEYIVQKEFKLD